jgi:hypothetical protein
MNDTNRIEFVFGPDVLPAQVEELTRILRFCSDAVEARRRIDAMMVLALAAGRV